MSTLTNATGVVLAGGRSKRFGSDKLVASYRGAPLIHRPIHALARLGAEVVVVCAPDAVDLPLPEDVALRVVRDAVLDEGPLAGVIAGLAEVRTPTALIAAGDMPELQVAVLRTMLRTLNEPGVQAVWLQDGDGPRPFPWRCVPPRPPPPPAICSTPDSGACGRSRSSSERGSSTSPCGRPSTRGVSR